MWTEFFHQCYTKYKTQIAVGVIITNPIIWRQGVCDPHVHVFNDKVYLYATHDCPCEPNRFRMQDWQIWSSVDLIKWNLEQTIYPQDFYCGALDQCWAVDAAEKNGTYYWYFSTGSWGVGVGVSDSPAGPFEDARKEAIVDYQTPPIGIPKWDPCVFQDDDGTAYIVVGDCRTEDSYSYLIAKLDDDMIHLAEPMREIEYRGNICPEDKASIHKYNGKYYLTHSSSYAISDCVYGPYEYAGNTGCNVDHGSYFTYKNQTYFASGGMDNPNPYYRASYLAPCHYRKNGDIVIDQEIMGYGCGQYDATMEKIHASWYFEASSPCKKEKENGSFVAELKNHSYLRFPNISNVEENTVITLFVFAANGNGTIRIHENTPDGVLLGSCTFSPSKNWDTMQKISCQLKNAAGNMNLCFVAEGESSGTIVELDSFLFESAQSRCSMQPALSVKGFGTIMEDHPQASWGTVLKNLNLKGACLEVAADGGSGGQATLEIDYAANAEQIDLHLFVNETLAQILSFSGTGTNIKKMILPISLKPGLNRIRLESRQFQAGSLAIDHVIVARPKEQARTYPAANGQVFPRGNGWWDGFPQRENDPQAYTGRVVKYLEVPEHGMTVDGINREYTGTCKIIFHYARGEQGNSSYLLKINGVLQDKVLEFAPTGSFALREGADYETEVILQSGNNEITLVKTGTKDMGIWLDAITVLPE